MSHSSFLSSGLSPGLSGDPDFYAEPFPDADTAWFWCVRTSEAIHAGARFQGGRATIPRPCEAVDIQTVVLRLARQNILTPNHVKVLAAYGPRHTRPVKAVAAQLWQQAMQRMTPILQQKGIVAP